MEILLENDNCLTQFVAQNSYFYTEFLIRSHFISSSILLSTPESINFYLSMCPGGIEDYDDVLYCNIWNPYITQLSQNCHLVILLISVLSTIVNVFQDSIFVKYRYSHPLFYIWPLENEVTLFEELKELTINQEVVLPPSKLVVLHPTQHQWAYFCYFCDNKENILDFKEISLLPAALEINELHDNLKISELNSGHGSSSATFQTGYTGTEYWYYRCGHTARFHHPRDVCHTSFFYWATTASRLNFSWHEGSYFDSLENFGNPLAFCETCDISGTQDTSYLFNPNTQTGLYYCKYRHEGTPLSWRLLTRPFQLPIWICLWIVCLGFCVAYKNIWKGLDIWWLILSQNVQWLKWPQILRYSFLVLTVLTCCYSSLISAKVTAPPPERVIPTIAELLTGKDRHKVVISEVELTLLEGRKEETLARTGLTNFSRDMAITSLEVVSVWGHRAMKVLADNKAAKSGDLDDDSITRMAFGGIQCVFVGQRLPSIRSVLGVRSHLAPGFIRLMSRLRQSLIPFWVQIKKYADVVQKIAHTRADGQEVVDVTRERIRPKKLGVDENIVFLAELYVVLIGGAVLGLVFEVRKILIGCVSGFRWKWRKCRVRIL